MYVGKLLLGTVIADSGLEPQRVHAGRWQSRHLHSVWLFFRIMLEKLSKVNVLRHAEHVAEDAPGRATTVLLSHWEHTASDSRLP